MWLANAHARLDRVVWDASGGPVGDDPLREGTT
jgi:hypothetical protein